MGYGGEAHGRPVLTGPGFAVNQRTLIEERDSRPIRETHPAWRAPPIMSVTGPLTDITRLLLLLIVANRALRPERRFNNIKRFSMIIKRTLLIGAHGGI